MAEKPNESEKIELTPKDILKSSLSTQYKSMYGKAPTIGIEEVEFEKFQTSIKDISNGKVLFCYGMVDVPILTLLFPDSLLATLEKEYIAIKKPEAGKDVKSIIIHTLAASLKRLTYLIADNTQYKKIDGKPSLLDSVSNSSFIANYDAGVKEEILWRTSEATILNIKLGTGAFYLSIRDIDWYYFNKRITDVKSFMEMVKTKVLPEVKVSSPTTAILPSVDFNVPNEFLLGIYFLPIKATCGKTEVYPELFSMHSVTKADIEKETYKYSFDLLIQQKKYSIYYTIPKGANDTNPKQYDSLIACMFMTIIKNSWSQSGITIDKKAGGPIPTIAPESLKGAVCLRTEIHYNETGLKCDILIPSPIVKILLDHFVDKNELELLNSNSLNEVTRIFTINRAIFRKHLSNFYKMGAAEILPEGSPVLFYQFANLLSDKDLKLVIQNFFVAAAWRTEDLKTFFYCSLPPKTGQEQPTLVFFPDYKEKKFIDCLPDHMKEEWIPLPIRPERTLQLQPLAIDKIKFIEKNNEVMKNIYEASLKGKLELSNKGVLVLKKEFASVVESKKNAELLEINTTNAGIFAEFKNIQKQALQKYFYDWNTADLSMVMIGWEDKMELLKPYISKNYYQSIEDSLKTHHTKMKDMTLDYDSVFKFKNKLIEYVKGMTEEAVV